jgi:hypothetical protein
MVMMAMADEPPRFDDVAMMKENTGSLPVIAAKTSN